MFHFHKSKGNEIIDMFYNTSRYLDDILTFDQPGLENHMVVVKSVTSKDFAALTDGCR